MPVVRLPDGTELRFPEGTPPEVMRNKSREFAAQRGLGPQPTLQERNADVVIPDPSTAPGGPNAPAPAEPESPFGTGRGLMLGTQAVGRGLADLAGLPADLASIPINLGIRGANFLAETDVPTMPGGSETIANLFATGAEVAGLPVIPLEEMSPEERIGREAIRFGTGGLGAGGALARAAQTGAATIRTPVVGAMVPARQQQPVSEAVRDVFGGLGAGTAIGATEQQLPEDLSPTARAFAETAAGLAGGVSGAAIPSIAQGVGRGARAGVERMVRRGPAVTADPTTGLRPSRTAERAAAGIAQAHAIDPQTAARNIRQSATQFADEGLPSPTSGVLSDDPGLIGLERRARRDFPREFAERDRKVQTAAGQQLRSMRPERTQEMTPEERTAFSRQGTDFLTRQAERRRFGAQERVSQAQERVAQTRGELEQTRQQQGEIVAPVAAQRGQEGAASRQLDKTVVEDTLQPLTRRKNEAIAAIDPERSIRVSSEGIVDTARQISDDVGRLLPENMAVPREFTERIARLAEKTTQRETGLLDEQGRSITRGETTGGEVTIGELVEVRPQLSTLEQQARRSGNYRLAGNLGELKRQINSELDDLIERGGPGSAEAAAAKTIYQEEYAPYFAEGTARRFRDAVQRDDLARAETPPTATAEQFLFAGGGAEEAAKALRRIIDIAPTREEGMQAVRRYMTARLARVLDAEGKANLKLTQKWIADHQDALNQFPEIKSEFEAFRTALVNNRAQETRLGQDLQRFSTELRAAEKNLAETNRRISNSALGVVLDKEPTKAVASIMQSGDPQKAMREIMGELRGQPRAKEAWQTAVADWLERKVTTTATGATADASDPVSWAKIHNEFRDHRRVLSEVFAEDEMQALGRVHRLLEPLNRRGVTGGATGSDTLENLNQMLRPLEVVLRWKFGHLRTGGIMRSIRMSLSSIPGLSERGAIDRLIVRMQLEPELAEHLLNAPTGAAQLEGWTQRLRRILMAGELGRELAEDGGENG